MIVANRIAFVLAISCVCSVLLPRDTVFADDSTLNIVVMDPLSLPLSCACVRGVGQRRYEPLAQHIKKSLGRDVNLLYEESLQLAKRRGLLRIDVVIGKGSVVLADAKETKMFFHSVASLSDRNGATEISGVVLVSKDGPIKTLNDLAGKRVAIGSAEHAECHQLAKDLFQSKRVGAELIDCGSIESAVYAFADQEADAVVVSDYLPPLLVGCGKLGKGETHAIATTQPTAGVQFFVSDDLSVAVITQLKTAIASVNADAAIKEALESQTGFVLQRDAFWSDWRGPNRDGQFPGLPKSLSEKPETIWRSTLTGPAMAGISATDRYVIVADKSADFKQDIFRAIDAATGESVWTIKHDAPKKMEYTNAPRATPVIVGQCVLLQSAFGRLICADLATGRELWTRHLVRDFGGKVPTWGFSVPPLVVGDRVIIAPGSATASVAALELTTGETVWMTPGHAPAYAPFISGTFGGREQIVGYDAAGLGGWDLKTGQRLWELIPPDNSDFHVGTPVKFDDGILLATENNGTRLYHFADDGEINTDPIAENFDCAPDTCTPVVVSSVDASRMFCTAYGELFCVALGRSGSDALKTIWSEMDERFYDHTCLIAGNGRILLWGSECDLLLIDATTDRMKIVSQWRPMKGDRPESMSHPAIVGDRIYLRSQTEIVCIRLIPKVP